MDFFDLDNTLWDNLKSYNDTYLKVFESYNSSTVIEYLYNGYNTIRNSQYSSFIFAVISIILILTICFCVFITGFIFGSISIFFIVNVIPQLTMTF